MKRLLLVFTILLFSLSCFATHQRAGEITYRWISGLTYEFTMVTYTYTASMADRPTLDMDWGDGTSNTVNRVQLTAVTADIEKNVYVAQHTYSNSGSFIVSMLDPNRNAGIVNIPNSVNVPFYIETLLVINPFIGHNSSPVLFNPPVDDACIGQPYIHNPSAYDADGDSLSYSLAVCKGALGEDIINFTYPALPPIFDIDVITGDLTWNYPVMQGEYNIAIIITEWRSGTILSAIRRDMQITVLDCPSQAPVIQDLEDTCIEVGVPFTINVVATDADLANNLKLSANGGIIAVNNPANFSQPFYGNGTVSGTLTWTPRCEHVRKNDYQTVFKVEDQSSPVSLIDIESWRIKVVAPAPTNFIANNTGNSITLNWDIDICSNVDHYKIYRKASYYGFNPSECEVGVPAYTGYQLVYETASNSEILYIDDNNGNGLNPGIEYCYMVVSVYPDGAESYATLEECASIDRDVPLITNVSVANTNLSSGIIDLAWSKPIDFDPVLVPPPYLYHIYRKDNSTNTLVLIDSTLNINDTTFTDNNLNTVDNQYTYIIDFLSNSTNRFVVGSSKPASSPYIFLTPGSRKIKIEWTDNVSWQNYEYVIYRKSPSSLVFDSIDITTNNFYTDNALINGFQYCYYIKTIGEYSAGGCIYPIINYSQERCEHPIDLDPPCAPDIYVDTDCELWQNYINWTNPNDSCTDDAVSYNLWYSPLNQNNLELLQAILDINTTQYIHANLHSIAGCYAISAIDSNGNESELSEIKCIEIDSCRIYILPNVFTPNGDSYNDILIPFPYDYVESVDFVMYNRLGTNVFQTTNPDIEWDGIDMYTGRKCSAGPYFYSCDIWEIRLTGLTKRSIHGTIYIVE